MTVSPASSNVLAGPNPPNTLDEVREVDLAGNTVRSMTLTTLNSRLSAAGLSLVADTIHHDFAILPNGHLILITNSTRPFNNLPGFPGTTTVLGDQLVDLDTNLNPVWVWDSFDHLDVNRHPYMFPDWTHSNAVLYSATDGNLLLSMRHQNWILKIAYQNGAGNGDVLWHWAEGGDFTLAGGVDPTDWFYAQHGPSFMGTNTAGSFALVVFDNGDDREFPSGVTCGSSGAPPCLYSTVPIFQIDEAAMTATLTFHDNLAPGYSFFGGNAEALANGNVEFNLCALNPAGLGAAEYEVTQQPSPQTVWQMQIGANDAYRAFRIPSLYPGVQW